MKEVRSVYFKEENLDVLHYLNEQPEKFSPAVISIVREKMVQEENGTSDLADGEVSNAQIMNELRALKQVVGEMQKMLTSSSYEPPPQEAPEQKKIKYDYSSIDDLWLKEGN